MFSFAECERRSGRAEEADSRAHMDNATAMMADSAEEGVWVFGYGSLCWFPGFEYQDSILGCVMGFKRRFWQGNATHRGTAVKPGRVATVVEEKEGVVWGRAFLVTGDAALPYLNQRECKLGGYATRHVLFHPYNPSTSSTRCHNARVPSSQAISSSTSGDSSPDSGIGSPTNEDLFAKSLMERLRIEEETSKALKTSAAEHQCRLDLSSFSLSKLFAPGCDTGFASLNKDAMKNRTTPFPAMMYVATEDNRHWLGKAPLHSMAEQIAECHGPSGSNADYLLNLARFMRTELPMAKDDHLFELERLVRERLAVRGQRALAEEAGAGREAATHQYTSRLPSKKLRCLNI